jgi:hypothetical protein
LHARRFRIDLGFAPRVRDHGHSRLIEHLRYVGKRNITNVGSTGSDDAIERLADHAVSRMITFTWLETP